MVSQRLVKTLDNNIIPAVEVMLKTQRIAELIADNRDSEILETIEKGREIYGSQSFDQSLLDLYHKGTISKSVALRYASNASDLNLNFEGIQKTGADTNRNITSNQSKGAFDLK